MTVYSLYTPGKIHFSGNTEQAWKSFKQKFDHYILAAGFKKRSDEEKVALLLNLGGDELLELYNSFDFPQPADNSPDPAKVLVNVLDKLDAYFTPRKSTLINRDKLDAHFAPRKSIVINRYKFHQCQQQGGETVEAFITRLKVLAKDCDFKTQRDTRLRDQLVFGCHDDKLREKFFREDNITLEEAEKIAATHQATLKQMTIFQDMHGTQEPVHKVVQKPIQSPNTRQSRAVTESKTESRPLKPCRFCGTKHTWRKEECPAYGMICSKCTKKNHFPSKCKIKQERIPVRTAIGVVQVDADDGDPEVQYAMNATDQHNRKEIIVSMLVCGKEVGFQVCTGAGVNILPQHVIPRTSLQPCNTILQMYDSSTLCPVGKCRLVITNCKTKAKHSVEFLVVNQDVVPILGITASEQMKLITVNKLAPIRNYSKSLMAP